MIFSPGPGQFPPAFSWRVHKGASVEFVHKLGDNSIISQRSGANNHRAGSSHPLAAIQIAAKKFYLLTQDLNTVKFNCEEFEGLIPYQS
jgi:hypothetical protein